ncbi:SUN3 protein, partial [Crypturellus undulatus]|nr:SUN3 protein [Crypturellus undulatus]
TIEQTKTSKSYAGNWICGAFGLFCAGYPPDIILQPELAPGKCWAFPGSQGQVVIRLPARILPRALTMQHSSKMLSAGDDISTSPKDISISGLDDEGQEIQLGSFLFDPKKEQKQFFVLKNELHKAFQYIKVNILSNWGSKEYTCLYHLKFHGKKSTG